MVDVSVGVSSWMAKSSRRPMMAECRPARRLLICAIQLRISDRRLVASRMFDCYEQRNLTIQGGWS